MSGQYTGLKNRRVPRYGRPAVVVAVLDTPVRDSERESGSTDFREPLDWVLGVIWDEDPTRGEFVTFHYDTRLSSVRFSGSTLLSGLDHRSDHAAL
jgi:hypothetical protein